MRKDKGLFPQPYIYFESLWNVLRLNNHIDILYALYNGQVISSILILKYNNTFYYEYGATNKKKLVYRPSHFLLWESIKMAHKSGYLHYDFGRTQKNNQGLRSFKDKWGTKSINLCYCYFPKTTHAMNLQNNIFLKNIMSYFTKILPLCVCQRLGKYYYLWVN